MHLTSDLTSDLSHRSSPKFSSSPRGIVGGGPVGTHVWPPFDACSMAAIESGAAVADTAAVVVTFLSAISAGACKNNILLVHVHDVHVKINSTFLFLVLHEKFVS